MKNLNKLLIIALLTFSNNSFSMHYSNSFYPLNEKDTSGVSNKIELQHLMAYTTKQSKSLLNEYYSYGYISNHKSIPQREYMQSFKISSGYSLYNTRSNIILKSYQDTSSNVFTFKQSSPIVSFTHNISKSNIFSFSYTLGYQRSVIEMNRKKFSSNKFLAFVNPRLTTMRKKRFETYFQLKIGVIYDDKKINDIKSSAIRYYLPPNFKLYTGFTPLGVTYNLSSNANLNFEWSVWSFETFSFGIKYNFKKNKDYESPKM